MDRYPSTCSTTEVKLEYLAPTYSRASLKKKQIIDRSSQFLLLVLPISTMLTQQCLLGGHTYRAGTPVAQLGFHGKVERRRLGFMVRYHHPPTASPLITLEK